MAGFEFTNWAEIVAEKDAEIARLKEELENVHERLSQAVKNYCVDLVYKGKEVVEVTEFNAEIQKYLRDERCVK